MPCNPAPQPRAPAGALRRAACWYTLSVCRSPTRRAASQVGVRLSGLHISATCARIMLTPLGARMDAPANVGGAASIYEPIRNAGGARA
jgi:hypothetical protein